MPRKPVHKTKKPEPIEVQPVQFNTIMEQQKNQWRMDRIMMVMVNAPTDLSATEAAKWAADRVNAVYALCGR